MSQSSDSERLAVVESQVQDIRNDVSEIKVDVKTLLLANATGVGVVQFIKTFAPWVAIVVSIAALLISQ